MQRNKKLAGSIASPANEIVACRYTISKRRCLAPAAPAPGCTATCTSYAYAYAGTPIQPTPQPPQPPQPTPHRQALHPAQPRQPPHPRKPPHPRAHPRQPPHLPQPHWASCTPLRRFSSSSKRRKVARLTSEISSSPSVIIMPGAKFGPVEHRPVGTAAAYALPASEKVNPAAPNAGTAVLVTRFFFEACFTRGMVASSNMLQEGSP